MPFELCHQSFRTGLLFVSFIEAFCGSYLALCLCEQLRIAFVTDKNISLLTRVMWYVSIGVALGGVGIWSMHFIGMTALQLRDIETGEDVEIEYNIAISILSIITVVFTTSLGVFISSHDKLFAKTKFEILEMFASHSSKMSLAQIQKMKSHTLLIIMSTRSLHYLILGGVVAGAGVVIMHYIGMEAMEIEGHTRWDIGIITASCLIAIIAATAAFWILFRLLSIFPEKEWLRITAAVIMTIAVCGMHYTGMAAATMIYSPENVQHQRIPSATIAQSDIAFPVFVVSAVVIYVLIMMAFSDMHIRYHRFYYHLRKTNQLDRIRGMSNISSGSFSASDFRSNSNKKNTMGGSPSGKGNSMKSNLDTSLNHNMSTAWSQKGNSVHPFPSPSKKEVEEEGVSDCGMAVGDEEVGDATAWDMVKENQEKFESTRFPGLVSPVAVPTAPTALSS